MTEKVDLPHQWQLLHWKKQVALAEELSGRTDITEASVARAILEGFERNNANLARAEAQPNHQPEVPAGEIKVPLRLLRDTWQGETRVRADGQITQWPLADAKRMIAQGVATRADPLPGEA